MAFPSPSFKKIAIFKGLTAKQRLLLLLIFYGTTFAIYYTAQSEATVQQTVQIVWQPPEKVMIAYIIRR